MVGGVEGCCATLQDFGSKASSNTKLPPHITNDQRLLMTTTTNI